MKHLSTALVAGALVAGAVAIAPVAAADANRPTYTHCNGSVVGQQPIRNGAGTVISRVQVWKAGSGNDTVTCIRNVHVGSYVGKRVFTSIVLDSRWGPNPYYYDRGDYAYYAGALRFNANYSVKVGGSDPSNPDVYKLCNRVKGKTATFSSGPIWLCYTLPN